MALRLIKKPCNDSEDVHLKKKGAEHFFSVACVYTSVLSRFVGSCGSAGLSSHHQPREQRSCRLKCLRSLRDRFQV